MKNMKTTTRKRLALLLCIALLSAFIFLPIYDLHSQVRDLETSNAKKDTRISELSEEVSDLYGDVSELSTKIVGKEEEIEKLRSDCSSTTRLLRKTQSDLTALRKEHAANIAELDTTRQQLEAALADLDTRSSQLAYTANMLQDAEIALSELACGDVLPVRMTLTAKRGEYDMDFTGNMFTNAITGNNYGNFVSLPDGYEVTELVLDFPCEVRCIRAGCNITQHLDGGDFSLRVNGGTVYFVDEDGTIKISDPTYSEDGYYSIAIYTESDVYPLFIGF